jgi:hypothetical protein
MESYIDKAAALSGTKMGFHYRSTRFPLGGHTGPALHHPAMAVLRSSHNAGKTKPQPKSFKELIGPLSQHSKLAEPKYADSSKLSVAHVWRNLDPVSLFSPLLLSPFYFGGS